MGLLNVLSERNGANRRIFDIFSNLEIFRGPSFWIKHLFIPKIKGM